MGPHRCKTAFRRVEGTARRPLHDVVVPSAKCFLHQLTPTLIPPQRATKRKTTKKVRNHLLPIVPTIESLGKSRQGSRTAGGECRGGRGGGREGEGRGASSLPHPLDGSSNRPGTLARASGQGATCSLWRNRSGAANGNPFPATPRPGMPLATGPEELEDALKKRWQKNSNYSSCNRSPVQREQRNLTGIHAAEASMPAACSRSISSGGGGGGRIASGGRGCGGGTVGDGEGDRRRQFSANGSSRSGGVWPGQEGARQVVHAGVEAITGLPLSGDERGDSATTEKAAPNPTASPLANNAAASAQSLTTRSSTAPEEGAPLSRGRVRRRRGGRSRPTPEVSQRPGRAADTNKNQRWRQNMSTAGGRFSATHSPGRDGDRPDTSAAPGKGAGAGAAPEGEATVSTTTAAAARSLREGVGNTTLERGLFGARSPPLIPAPHEASRLDVRLREEASPCGNHQQWGGFGPGHVPKYFRGRFGVAGEKKALARRQNGDGLGQDENGDDHSNRKESLP